MDRLTYWNDEFQCWTYKCSSGDAALVLKAFEDTGITPGEIIMQRAELSALRATNKALENDKYNAELNLSRLTKEITALRDEINSFLNEAEQPLTLNELHKMIGEPVWCDKIKRWGVLGQRYALSEEIRIVVGFCYGWEWLEDVMRTGAIYRRKPAAPEQEGVQS